MFYCKDCELRTGWPDGMVKSKGLCEICSTYAVCSDVPSRSLPERKDQQTDRRENRKAHLVTQKQILAAMHEYAWTFHGYHGRGPEVEAKHAEVVAMLVEAGLK